MEEFGWRWIGCLGLRCRSRWKGEAVKVVLDCCRVHKVWVWIAPTQSSDKSGSNKLAFKEDGVQEACIRFSICSAT